MFHWGPVVEYCAMYTTPAVNVAGVPIGYIPVSAGTLYELSSDAIYIAVSGDTMVLPPAVFSIIVYPSHTLDAAGSVCGS
jgi:hypothetical protein